MIDPEARVCARCGAPASDEAVCSCGANLAGPSVKLARFGGGSPVVASENACIVVSHHRVFIQQPNRNWGQVKAFATSQFGVVAAPGHWALDQPT